MNTTSGQSMAEVTDERLMELVQLREQAGLTLLHIRYAAVLKVLGMKVLHNDADASDLIQEAFVEIWNRASTYDHTKGRPFSWMATLTRRRAIDRLRKRDTYCRFETRFAEESATTGEGWTHVHEDLGLTERNLHLQKAMALLPEAQRRAIHLAYHQEMTQREIANLTGIPLGTIKTQLQLGLKKMAHTLSGFREVLLAELPCSEMKS